MNRRYCCLFVVLFWAVLIQAAATERTFNILFLQSYTAQTPWHSSLNQGLAKGFRREWDKGEYYNRISGCRFLDIPVGEGNHAPLL